MNLLTGVLLAILLFFVFDRWDRKKEEGARDMWGPWGVLFPVGSLGLVGVAGALGYMVSAGEHLGFEVGMYLFVALYSAIGLVFALFVLWSFRGRKRRLAAVLQ